MSEYYPLPQPDEIPKREREDAMGAYFMMFAAMAAGLPLPMLNLIASIIYLWVNKSKSRFVHFHALQSLWSQLPTTLLNIGLVYWTLQIWLFDNYEYNDYYLGYLGMVLIANLIYFIFSIVGAVKARKGVMYYFIFFGRLSYEQAYRVKPGDSVDQAPIVNKPPS
jgi:uncharacterized membrane protein